MQPPHFRASLLKSRQHSLDCLPPWAANSGSFSDWDKFSLLDYYSACQAYFRKTKTIKAERYEESCFVITVR
jgi:hypothetical protein